MEIESCAFDIGRARCQLCTWVTFLSPLDGQLVLSCIVIPPGTTVCDIRHGLLQGMCMRDKLAVASLSRLDPRAEHQIHPATRSSPSIAHAIPKLAQARGSCSLRLTYCQPHHSSHSTPTPSHSRTLPPVYSPAKAQSPLPPCTVPPETTSTGHS